MFKELRRDIKNGNRNFYNGEKFVLYGIIVHDPNNEELKNTISSNFIKWAEMTGEHFLFITFIHASKDWKKSKYWQNGYGINKGTMMVDRFLSEEDEQQTIPLLRDFLDLPKEGSFLILTEDLGSNQFDRILITKDTLESQLALIAKFCEEDAQGISHSPGDYKKLMNELNADAVSMVQSLIDIMFDFTSIASSFPTSLLSPYSFNKEQIKYAEKVIIRERSALMEYNKEDFEDRLFHFLEAVSNFYDKLQVPFFRVPTINYVDECKYLDYYSFKLLRSYEIIKNQISLYQDSLDYSGLTIYLGKIVENEINLSIGQMIRYALGILMPQFYNKYCWDAKIHFTSNNKVINFNKKISDGNDMQCSIPMGDLLHAYDNICNHPDVIYSNPKLDKEKLEIINPTEISFLQDFCRDCRNPAGHLDEHSEETYNLAKDRFDIFIKDYLKSLSDIRHKLKDAPKIPIVRPLNLSQKIIKELQKTNVKDLNKLTDYMKKNKGFFYVHSGEHDHWPNGTAQHSWRVYLYMRYLWQHPEEIYSREINNPQDVKNLTEEEIILTGLLHDLGKMWGCNHHASNSRVILKQYLGEEFEENYPKVVGAIFFHHHKSKDGGTLNRYRNDILTAFVRLADRAASGTTWHSDFYNKMKNQSGHVSNYQNMRLEALDRTCDILLRKMYLDYQYNFYKIKGYSPRSVQWNVKKDWIKNIENGNFENISINPESDFISDASLLPNKQGLCMVVGIENNIINPDTRELRKQNSDEQVLLICSNILSVFYQRNSDKNHLYTFSMRDEIVDRYYELGNGGGIFLPQVTFFRKGEKMGLQLVEPWKMDVLLVPNLGQPPFLIKE